MKHGIIDYETIGQGIPVLIIHGWGISKITMKGAFEPIFEKLGGYKRYYIDLPGMGQSERGDVKIPMTFLPCFMILQSMSSKKNS